MGQEGHQTYVQKAVEQAHFEEKFQHSKISRGVAVTMVASCPRRSRPSPRSAPSGPEWTALPSRRRGLHLLRRPRLPLVLLLLEPVFPRGSFPVRVRCSSRLVLPQTSLVVRVRLQLRLPSPC